VAERAQATTVTVVTWNVWFAERAFEERAEATLRILRECDADLIALQEVTAPFLERAMREEWVRADYAVSDPTRASVRNYGVAILSRMPVRSFELHPLTSGMGRKLLVARLLVNGHEIAFATAHFESLRESEPVRATQLREAFAILRPFENAVLVGDFNLCSTSKENRRLDPAYVDLWPLLHPDDPGWTQDTERNAMLAARRGPDKPKSVRFDRVLARSKPGVLKPEAIMLLGTEEVSANVFPSDHFGLRAVLRVS